MRRSSRCGWGLAVLALFAVPAHAQDLATFLAAARRANLDQREAAAIVARREAEASRIVAQLYPTVTARGFYTRNQYASEVLIPTQAGAAPERVTIVPRDQLDATFTVELPLVDPGRWAGARAAVASRDAALRDADATAEQVERAVVQAYFALLASRAVSDAAARAIAAAEQLVAQTADRLAAGAASDIDVARARADLEGKRQEQAAARELAATDARALESLTGLAPGALALPEGELLAPEAPLEAWLRGAGRVPVVAAAHAASRAARLEAGAAWLRQLPSLSASATERLTNATSFAGQDAFYVAELALSVRLDPQAWHAAKAQDAQAEAAEVRAARALQDARDRVHADWQRVQALQAGLRAATAQHEATATALRLLADRYAAGIATSLELVEASRDAYVAEASRVRAQAQLAAARALLRRSSGVALDAAGP